MKIAGKSMKIFSLTFPVNSDFWLRNLHVLVGISISLLNSATQKTRLPTQGLLSSLAIAHHLGSGLGSGRIAGAKGMNVFGAVEFLNEPMDTYGILWVFVYQYNIL
jgi:hypothetical protein